MTSKPSDESLPPIEPLNLSEITSPPVVVQQDAQQLRGKKGAGAAAGTAAPGGAQAQQAGAKVKRRRSETVSTEVVSSAAAGGEVLIRKRKLRRSARGRRSQKRRRILLAVAGVVLIIAAACFAAVSIGGYNLHNTGMTAGNLLEDAAETTGADAQPAVTYNEGRTVEFEGATYTLKENMVSILFLGYDARLESSLPAQADVLILLAIDTETGAMTGISIPRDSMVEVDSMIGDAFTGISVLQVCLAFAYGDVDATSCEYTARAVSRIVYNIPVSAYFALNMQGVVALNDAIGGVALTPLATIEGAGAVEGVPTVLEGSQALSYVQSRGDGVESSLRRQERQMQYVQAFAAQALDAAKGDVGVLLDLYDVASSYTITNLGVGEFGYLASQVLMHGMSSLDLTSLSGTMEQGEVYAEYYLDDTEVLRTVLNVYYQKVSEEANSTQSAESAESAQEGESDASANTAEGAQEGESDASASAAESAQAEENAVSGASAAEGAQAEESAVSGASTAEGALLEESAVSASTAESAQSNG